MAKANRNLIVNHKGEEHEKQIVSDSMYSQNDHYYKFWILRSNVLVGSTFYKYTITSSKTIIKISKHLFVLNDKQSIQYHKKTFWFDEWNVLDTAIMRGTHT